MILGYKIYLILYIFAASAVLGYLAEQILYGIGGRLVKRGSMKGPYSLLYGLVGVVAALLAVVWNPGISPGEMSPQIFRFLAVSVLIFALVLELLSIAVMRFISGMNLYGFNIVILFLAGVCGILVAFQGVALFRKVELLPTWAMMVILLVFYIPFLSDAISTGFRLYDYRFAMEQVEFLPDSLQEFALLSDEDGARAAGEEVVAVMRPYRRWLRAYPRFYKRTYKDMERFLGETTAERLMRRVLY